MGILEALHDGEIDIFRTLNQAGSNSILDAIMVFFTVLGISYVIVLVCIPLWFTGRRNSAVDVVIVIVLVTIVTEAVKVLVDRPRPFYEIDNVNTILSASGPSFPSAHASRAFAVATLVCFRESLKVRAVALSLAFLISLSRIYLGVHWPTDVIAGALLGVAVAAAFEFMSRKSGSYKSLREKIIGKLSRPSSVRSSSDS